MFRASAMAFWWIDLALRVHKTADEIGILEINFFHSVLAEMAEFFFNGANLVAVTVVIHTGNNKNYLI